MRPILRGMGIELQSETRIVVGRLTTPGDPARPWWWQASIMIEGNDLTIGGMAASESDAILEAAAGALELRLATNVEPETPRRTGADWELPARTPDAPEETTRPDAVPTITPSTRGPGSLTRTATVDRARTATLDPAAAPTAAAPTAAAPAARSASIGSDGAGAEADKTDMGAVGDDGQVFGG